MTSACQQPRLRSKQELIIKAREAVQANDWTEALSRCNTISKTFPDHLPPAYFMMKFRALNNLGRVDEAKHVLNDAVSRGVPQANLWVLWIKDSVKIRDWPEVARRASLAVKQFPDNPLPALFEGIAWLMLGDISRAQTSLDSTHGEVTALVLKVLRTSHGDALAHDFEIRWRTVSDSQGIVAGTQHLRNLMLQGPEALTADEGTIPNIPPWVANLVLRTMPDVLGVELQKIADWPEVSNRTPIYPARRPMIVCAYMTEATPGPHMRFINGFAGALATLDEVEKVTILVTQECEPECVRAPVVDAGPWDAQREEDWHRDLAHVAGDYVHKINIVVVGKHGAVFPQEAALDLARTHDPDILFPIIGILESPVVAQILARNIPTIAIQSSMTNDVPKFADIVMAHGGGYNLDEPEFERCRSYRIPVYPFPRTGEKNPTIPQSSARLRIVTAMSGSRLNKLIRPNSPHRKEMAAFLRNNPDIDWLLLGAKDPEQCRAILGENEEDGLKTRVTIGGFVPDLRAAFETCDIYLQPSTNAGGAMGVAMALEEGLPIVAMRDCDAGNFLPLDSLIESDKDVVDKLQELVSDPEARTKLANIQRTHMHDHHSIKTCGQDMAALMKEAHTFFSGRAV